jgi:hypothetical protein
MLVMALSFANTAPDEGPLLVKTTTAYPLPMRQANAIMTSVTGQTLVEEHVEAVVEFMVLLAVHAVLADGLAVRLQTPGPQLLHLPVDPHTTAAMTVLHLVPAVLAHRVCFSYTPRESVMIIMITTITITAITSIL